MGIKKLDVKSLTNDRHLGFMEQVCSILDRTTYETQKMYEERKKALKTAVEKEDEAYRKSQKNFKTDELQAEDELRDKYMRAAKHILDGYAVLPDKEKKKQQALELLQVWKDYKFSTNDSYNGQTVKIENMWQDFQKKETVLKELGVWDILESALNHNNMVSALFQLRNKEKSEIVVGALKAARAASDSAYQQLIETMDAIEVVTPGAISAAFYSQLTELAEYYKQYYLSRKSSGRKKEEENVTEEESEVVETKF